MSARPAGPPRIGLCGFFLECNRWSRVSGAEAFAEGIDLAGDALAAQLRAAPSRLLPDMPGFVATMDAAGPWEPVPLRIAAAQPGGPAEQAYFDGLVAEVEARIAAAGPLDGVFASMHGAALATGSEEAGVGQLQRTEVEAVLGPGGEAAGIVHGGLA